MKGFALALLCVVLAVQARNLDLADLSGTVAAAGENPWVVHLRVARSTGGGLLDTCVGSLIDASWILTSATCVQDARFIWIRYGAVDVIRPELVTETTAVFPNPNFNAETGENNIALIRINRVVQSTDNIRPLSLAGSDAEVPSVARFCGYGVENDAPGEQLRCFDANLEVAEDGSITATSEDGAASQFDIGGPLVSDGVQFGVLTASEGSDSVFLNPGNFREWIQQVSQV